MIQTLQDCLQSPVVVKVMKCEVRQTWVQVSAAFLAQWTGSLITLNLNLCVSFCPIKNITSIVNTLN